MTKPRTFIPTDEWQDVPDDAVLPPGLDIKLNLETGQKQARLRGAPRSANGGDPDLADLDRQYAEEAAAAAASAVRKDRPQAPRSGASDPEMMSLDELLSLDFKPVKWIVPAVLCEGLTIFAGRPKLGKSWSVLDWALAVSGDRPAFSSITCETGDVLVIALEDSKRRLQSRLRKLGVQPNKRMTLCVAWPRIDQGGIEAIRAWLDKHPIARLIVIDTLAKVRPRGIPNKDAYQADADALTELHKLANERAVAIVVVHHTRKALADDWLDTVAGTTGLTGVADSTIVLKRERGQADAFLFGTGRDLPDYELPLKFDEQTCRWHRLDMAAPEARATAEQAAILNALRAACGSGLLRSQIAAMTDRSKTAVSHALRRMELAGLVEAKGNLWHLTI